MTAGDGRVSTVDSDWWRGAVIYEVYPRSFQDTDGDGIGDLAGITLRLPYLADLGVDAIWIAPFFRSPMLDFGYDVSDYTAVDPIFGSIQDLDRLVSEAHALGIRVMIDQVLSHTSDRHPWFRQSRVDRENSKADWYVWPNPTARRPIIGWRYSAARPGNGTTFAASTTCISFWPSSRTLTFTILKFEQRCLKR